MRNRRARVLSVFLACGFLLGAGAFGARAGEPAAGEVVFQFEVLESVSFAGRVSTAEDSPVVFEWGDGTRTSHSGNNVRVTKRYDEPGTRTVRVRAADATVLRSFETSTNIAYETGGLPAGLERLTVTGRGGAAAGDVADLPRGLLDFLNRYGNEITGDVADLPPGLVNFALGGSNTLGGETARLPRSLETFALDGSNTLGGDVMYLPSGLTAFRCHGDNALTGEISRLPRALVLFSITGTNTVSGNVEDLPEGLTSFLCQGSNTIAGEIGKLPRGLVRMDLLGRNTLAGDVADLPRGLTYFRCYGRNTVSGNLADLPPELFDFRCAGLNSLGGNLADLPAGIRILELLGQNTVSEYRAGRDWAEEMTRVEFSPRAGHGLDSAGVDALLADLARVEKWTGTIRTRRIILGGGNARRSGASDEAVGKLEAAEIEVTTN